jgi:hypothetical protein
LKRQLSARQSCRGCALLGPDHGRLFELRHQQPAFLITYFNDLGAVDLPINMSLVLRKEGGWFGNFPGAPADFDAAMFKTVTHDLEWEPLRAALPAPTGDSRP